MHFHMYLMNILSSFLFFNAIEEIIQSIKFEESSNQTDNNQAAQNQLLPGMTAPPYKIENILSVMTEIWTTSKNQEMSDQVQTEQMVIA